MQYPNDICDMHSLNTVHKSCLGLRSIRKLSSIEDCRVLSPAVTTTCRSPRPRTPPTLKVCSVTSIVVPYLFLPEIFGVIPVLIQDSRCLPSLNSSLLLWPTRTTRVRDSKTFTLGEIVGRCGMGVGCPDLWNVLAYSRVHLTRVGSEEIF